MYMHEIIRVVVLYSYLSEHSWEMALAESSQLLCRICLALPVCHPFSPCTNLQGLPGNKANSHHDWCNFLFVIAWFLLLCMTQVPSQEEEGESEKSLQKFVEELPVLELVGKLKHIQPNQ